MTRTKSHFQVKEPILETFLQKLRFNKVLPFISSGDRVLDMGCGYNGALLKILSPKISEGVGIDISVTKRQIAKNIILLTLNNSNKKKIQQNYFDKVVSLAVLEHLNNPLDYLKIAYKSLKRGGMIILTTPSPKAKLILEFMAFKLGIISEQEIRDHKKYYNNKELSDLLVVSGFKSNHTNIEYFSFGLNTFVVAER